VDELDRLIAPIFDAEVTVIHVRHELELHQYALLQALGAVAVISEDAPACAGPCRSPKCPKPPRKRPRRRGRDGKFAEDTRES